MRAPFDRLAPPSPGAYNHHLAYMSRFPPLPRDKLQPAQQEIHDESVAIAEKAFGLSGELFEWRDQQGALIGPYPFALAIPEPGRAILKQALHLGRLPLPADAKETAILACGARFGAGYELYAHGHAAEKAGLSSEQIHALKAGRKPERLSEVSQVAFDVSTYLANKSGPLPDALFKKSVEVLGREGTIALVHYVGCYAYICIMLNAADVPVP